MSSETRRFDGDGRLGRIGVVIHPTRDVNQPMGDLVDWASSHGVDVGQIAFGDEPRHLAEDVVADDCDLLVAIGGDGTALAAIRSSTTAGRPVVGVACGSLGALTVVAADRVGAALDRFVAGDWVEKRLPALAIDVDGDERAIAFNDLAVVRQGEGQVRISAAVDGTLFARFAGDGCIVATPLGSSAYTIGAGGPLLPVGIEAYVLTPLPTHGGFRPPLVVNGESELELEIVCGYGGARLELDGQIRELHNARLTVGLQADAATVVSFPDQAPFMTLLRERGIISDSPRILAEDERLAREAKA